MSVLGPLLGAGVTKRSSVVCIDLGQRVSKAVWVQRKHEKFELLNYALLDAPTFEKAPPRKYSVNISRP